MDRCVPQFGHLDGFNFECDIQLFSFPRFHIPKFIFNIRDLISQVLLQKCIGFLKRKQDITIQNFISLAPAIGISYVSALPIQGTFRRIIWLMDISGFV
jgi:hypothetical protein